MSKIALIIFDCDGVLVDSERVTTIAFGKVLEEECGLSLSFETLIDTFMGQSSQKSLQIIEEMLGHKIPVDLEAHYQNEIKEALQESVTAITGVEKALSELSIPYCVASGGSYEKMYATLGKTKLLPYFEKKLFSTSDVLNGKPHPDVYLHAAKNMNCANPNQCLVIEDSPIGVKGGVAAGMKVFGFADLVKKQTLIESGAHHIITEMGTLANELENYEKLSL